jgi:hypothetical protein
MNTKKTYPIALLFLTIALLFYACANEKKTDEKKFLKQGEYYFKLDDKLSTEFIHIKFIDSTTIEGEILLLENEQKVAHHFGGSIISDSIMNVYVSYQDAELLENWVIHFDGTKISLKNSLERPENYYYSIITIDKIMDYSKYIPLENSVNETDEESEMETYCYQSKSSNANKRNVLTEYIQLWIENRKVTGRGAGESEGDPNWIFKFNGDFVNDTTIEVKVNYIQEGVSPLNTSETWIIDKKKSQMHLLNTVSGRPGANAYFEIDAKDLPNGMLKLMEQDVHK